MKRPGGWDGGSAADAMLAFAVGNVHAESVPPSKSHL
jgi:hypothetical protein